MLYYSHSFFLIEYLYQCFIAMCMMQFVECSIQVIAQQYRIIACFKCRQPFFCLERQKGRSKHAGERSLGSIIGFAERHMLAMLCDEFGRGVEEVLQGAEELDYNWIGLSSSKNSHSLRNQSPGGGWGFFYGVRFIAIL